MFTLKVSASELRAFLDRWPCHGVSPKLHTIAFTFARNGDLVDIEAKARNGRTLASETYDGSAILALSQELSDRLAPVVERLQTFAAYNPSWYERSFARIKGNRVELRYSSDQGTGIIGTVTMRAAR